MIRLACAECDREDQEIIVTAAQAEARGWHDVMVDESDEDGHWWKHIGICPRYYAAEQEDYVSLYRSRLMAKTTNTSWKTAERLIAHRLFGEAGCRVVRHRGGKTADIGDIGIAMEDGTVVPPPTMRIDVKHAKTHGAFNQWRKIQKVCHRGSKYGSASNLIPVVCLREHGSPRTLVVLDLEDVERFAAHLADLP